ncbi:fungal-specific transcription factor domain-containing protein [Macrophomina phaseolina]|uniref:Fungal-specific transcription factor domain-containing protein n=1 Tax=Macrophomina phaseolina TaxID=35725 RepID=A0ABQ8GKF0_9PEZI|nr:fungal-specific transcription factor domain-containing protein [Macrophomina phaseolina]
MIPKEPELRNLQAILLFTLYMTRSSNSSDSRSLWHISRFAMSVAIEIGAHRNSPNWEFGALDQELKNRAWWCTYGLERMIAVSTGRTLSLRNQAIDAAFPRAIPDDILSPDEARIAHFFQSKGVLPATLMFQLFAIGGDILESVYIARPRLSMSAESMQNLVNSLRKRLISWRVEAEHLATGDDCEFLEMRIWFSLLILLCNRPSPSSPEPTPEAIESCAEASKVALIDWSTLLDRGRLSPLWRTFHDILMTGLVWTYCIWKSPRRSSIEFQEVSAACSNLLKHVAKGGAHFNKFVQLYDSLAHAVLASRQRAQSQDMPTPPTPGPAFVTLPDETLLDNHFNEAMMDANASFDLHAFDDVMRRIPNFLDQDMDTNPFHV